VKVIGKTSDGRLVVDATIKDAKNMKNYKFVYSHINHVSLYHVSQEGVLTYVE
jgi:hypothetical protein